MPENCGKSTKGGRVSAKYQKVQTYGLFSQFSGSFSFECFPYLTILRSDDNFPRDICPCNICQGTNFFNQKFFLDQEFFLTKIFLIKNFFDQKLFSAKIIFRPKILVNQNLYLTKKMFQQKNMSRQIFSTKSLFRPIIVFDRKFVRPRIT